LANLAKVNFEGKEEAAEELSFETAREGWSEYSLEDGTVLKLKNVVSRIFRLLNRKKPDGSPFLILEGTAVVTSFTPSSIVTVAQATSQPGKEN
jgi:hypothetical protein